MSTITWKYKQPAATEAMIAGVEARLGIRYPDDFRSMAPEIHGASPAPSSFGYRDRHLGWVGGSLGRILSFSPSSSFYVLPTIEAHLGEGILPTQVVPFAIDGGGDLMAFDFRTDATNPPVVYVAIADAEEAGERHIAPLASSFSTFLDMLEAE